LGESIGPLTSSGLTIKHGDLNLTLPGRQMMRGNLGNMILAAVLAWFMATPILAGEKAKLTEAQAAGQTVEQQAKQGLPQETVPQTEEEPVAVVEQAVAEEGDPPPVLTEPPVEPQEVLKTKTKSNQSND